jgi:hypothetical protein
MPIAPPVAPPAPLAYTVLDLVTDAFIEIGAVPPGEDPSPEEAQWGLRQLNDLIDIWQALAKFVYSYQFVEYTLVAGLSPHTIGPSGTATFDTKGQPRPVRLESCALLLNQSPGEVDYLMGIRDHDWWAAQQVKQIQTNVPTDVFYDPTSPDGSLYFWPVPNAQRQVRIQTWQTVSQFVSIQDPIGGPGGPGTLPQGYRAALKFTLAEMLLPGSNREENPLLSRKALQARSAIFANNQKSPRMSTQDSGMPRAGAKTGTRGDFNWFTGGAPGGRPE